MNLRFIDWIWHIRGSLPLAPALSGTMVWDRLDPLFQQVGTSHQRTTDTLAFQKKGQAAQDKMAVFDSGALWIEPGADGLVLRYHLISRVLLYCFLAPLLFIGIAQLTIAMGRRQEPAVAAAAKHGKAAAAAHKPKTAEVPMNPLDKALGAPAPEKPKDGKDADKGPGKKPSPTPAYVFAGIFAALYVVGRILEDRLIRAAFQKCLRGPDAEALRIVGDAEQRSAAPTPRVDAGEQARLAC